nr:hypothetical protein 15 [bacterium]
MSTVTEAFTATGTGNDFLARANESFTYQISGSATATWVLERTDNGSTWAQVATGTADAGPVTVNQGAIAQQYRFRCTAYTSGTMTCTLTDVTNDLVEGAPVYSNKDLTTVFEVREDGITTQKVSRAGDLDTYLDLSDDEVDLYAGNRRMVNFYGGAGQDEVSFNPGGVDIDFKVNGVSGDDVILYEYGAESSAGKLSLNAPFIDLTSDNQTEIISAAGAVSVNKRNTKLALAGSGAVTLAAPHASMIGQIKVIEMTADNGDVTLALTNVQGQSSGTTATFNDVGDSLLLVAANNSKWTVIKEFGIALS